MISLKANSLTDRYYDIYTFDRAQSNVHLMAKVIKTNVNILSLPLK